MFLTPLLLLQLLLQSRCEFRHLHPAVLCGTVSGCESVTAVPCWPPDGRNESGYRVISVGKMTPGHAQYFEGEVAAGREDYYAGRGEAPGVWRGSGAASAGLEGEVLDGQLGRLFDMRHPI